MRLGGWALLGLGLVLMGGFSVLFLPRGIASLIDDGFYISVSNLAWGLATLAGIIGVVILSGSLAVTSPKHVVPLAAVVAILAFSPVWLPPPDQVPTDQAEAADALKTLLPRELDQLNLLFPAISITHVEVDESGGLSGEADLYTFFYLKAGRLAGGLRCASPLCSALPLLAAGAYVSLLTTVLGSAYILLLTARKYGVPTPLHDEE